MKRSSLSAFAAKLSPRRLRWIAVFAGILVFVGLTSAVVSPGGADASTAPTVTAP